MKSFKTFFLSITLLFTISTFEAQICIDSNLITGSFCPTVIDPVCGCDGITYNNSCEALNWYGVTAWTQGACGASSNCQAGFTAYPDSNCAVYFQNNSTGAANYVWNFGDGGTSGQTSPQYIYPTSGAYTVTLYAYDSLQNICDTATQIVSVFCGGGCNLIITDSIVNPSACDTCDGYAAIYVAGGAPPYTYMWCNNQSTSSTAFQMCAGNCAVMVADANGCVGSINITLTAPQPMSVTGNTYDESSCGANDGSINVTATGGTPAYQYSIDGINYQSSGLFTGLSAGLYVVSALDSSGCSSVYTAQISCSVGCQANFSAIPDSLTGCYVYFQNNSTGASSYQWYFGDGGSSSQISPQYTYLNSGTYSISLYAYDSTGAFCDSTMQLLTVNCGGTTNCIDSSQVNLGVFCPTVIDPVCGCDGATYNNSCEAENWYGVTSWTQGPCGGGTSCLPSFAAVPDSNNGCTIYFMNTSSGATTNQWYFGDGGMSNLMSPTHTYTSSGTYSVSLYLYDNLGNFCDSTTQMIPVNCGGNPCNLILYDSIVNPSFCGMCDGMATVFASGGTAPYTYMWCNGQTTATVYQMCVGTCPVTVTDANGCTGTINVTLTAPTPLTLTGWSIDESFCGAFDGAINVTASGGTPGYLYSIDGITYQTSGSFTGLTAGVYLVYAMDAGGCTSMFTVQVLCPIGCQVNFTAYPDSNCVVYFQNNSTGGFVYYWSFGDGGSSNQFSPSHTYPSSGTYEVSLFAYDSLGNYCDSDTQMVSINCGGVGIEQFDPGSSLTIYPNPLSDLATIEFSLDQFMNVELMITNVIGEQVDVISSGNLSSGKHKLQWNNQHLSSGIYLLHMITSYGKTTKKLIVER